MTTTPKMSACGRPSLASLFGCLALTLWTSARAQSALPCVIAFKSPQLVKITGQLTEVVIDDRCEYAYVTNATDNTVEVVSLGNATRGTPITVGSAPTGLDLSPDGKTLYVADSGGATLSVVDIRAGSVTKTVIVPPPKFSSDTPFSLTVANNGLVFFSTTFAGSGFGGRLMQYNPVTGGVIQRTDFPPDGLTTEITFLKSSGDRSTVGIVEGDASDGPVFRYSSGSNTFSATGSLDAFIRFIALDRTGSTLLVNPGTFVLNSSLSVLGTIAATDGPASTFGVAVDPAGGTGYRVSTAGIDVLNLKTFLQSGSIAPGDTLTAADEYRHGVGEMAISGDGSLLAVITDHGVSLVRSPVSHIVNFSALRARAEAHLRYGAELDSFSVDGGFHLGGDNRTIDPTTSGALVNFGSTSTSIPASLFHASGRKFEATIANGSMTLEIRLDPDGAGGYHFAVSGRGANLSATSLPISLGLAFGADAGGVTLGSGEVEVDSR